MEYTIHQAGKSAYVIVGPKGATNFTIVKDTSAQRILSMPTSAASTESKKR